MAAKNIEQNDLTTTLIELLTEYVVASRNFSPKKANVRVLKRSIGTIEAILSDIREELSKEGVVK